MAIIKRTSKKELSDGKLSGSNGGIIAYDQVQDEGTNLPKRPIMDFVGAGVTAYDDGTKTIIQFIRDVDGGSASSVYLTSQSIDGGFA